MAASAGIQRDHRPSLVISQRLHAGDANRTLNDHLEQRVESGGAPQAQKQIVLVNDLPLASSPNLVTARGVYLEKKKQKHEIRDGVDERKGGIERLLNFTRVGDDDIEADTTKKVNTHTLYREPFL